MNFKEAVNAVGTNLKKNAPAILTGSGVTSCAMTVVSVVEKELERELEKLKGEK